VAHNCKKWHYPNSNVRPKYSLHAESFTGVNIAQAKRKFPPKVIAILGKVYFHKNFHFQGRNLKKK